ncbi:hypothetical protein [Sulfurimonas sp.]
MKLFIGMILLFIFFGCNSKVKIIDEKSSSGVHFTDIWNQIESDKYQKLPKTKVSYFKLSKNSKDIIAYDAMRTLQDHSDILPPFEKLAHPNGICFKGIWAINQDNIYSGYFANGTHSLIIARASTAMSNTKSGTTRAFGFAGKLFGTTKSSKQKMTTGNFFLINDLGGTDAKYYADVSLTNEPPLSITLEVIHNLLYAIKVSSAFSHADINPHIRQLYEISELGVTPTQKIITPKWLKIKMQKREFKDAKDFRNELQINDEEKLIFDIYVANKLIKQKRNWQKIGIITLDTSVVSPSCDRRLHFHHPKWRNDLDYGVK